MQAINKHAQRCIFVAKTKRQENAKKNNKIAVTSTKGKQNTKY